MPKATRTPIDSAIRQHSDRIRRILRHSGLSPADAEDVLQDALTVFAERFDEVAPHSRRPFLVNTARRIAADWRRLACNRAVAQSLCDDDLQSDSDLEAKFALSQATDILVEALSVLPPDERAVLVLSLWQEQSRTSIADALKLPVGTVASRLAAATKHLDSVVRQIQSHHVSTRLAAGSGRRHAPARCYPEVVECVRPFATREVGNLRYFNNQFGRGAVSGSYDQCLVSRVQPAGRQLGWSWNWPEHAHTVAYPEVVCGWSPWLGQGPGEPQLPVPIRQLKKLVITYDVETRASGRFGLLALISLARSVRKDGARDPALLTAEIAIQLEMNGIGEVLGRPLARPRVGSVEYAFWQWRSLGGTDPAGLPSYVFWNGTGQRQGTIEVRSLVDYLLGQRLVSEQDWLTCCELGNEISGGRGTTWVNQFDVNIETA